MHKYRMTLAYDGTHYAGWQIQPNALTIQELVQKALSTALRTPTFVTASGRTDAGVHALAQIAHFTHDAPLDTTKLLLSLNGLLPLDIRILQIEQVDLAFHARYSATAKTYHYHLHLERTIDPFKRLYAYRPPHPLDLELLRQGAQLFVGKHDFTSFANEPERGSVSRGGVRTLYRLDIVPESGGVRLEFEGDGFLYKMVRNIVGTLIDLASGKIPLEEINTIFQAKDRRRAGVAAPPQGLFLVEVKYAS